MIQTTQQIRGENYTAQEIETETISFLQEESNQNISDLLARERHQTMSWRIE